MRHRWEQHPVWAEDWICKTCSLLRTKIFSDRSPRGSEGTYHYRRPIDTRWRRAMPQCKRVLSEPQKETEVFECETCGAPKRIEKLDADGSCDTCNEEGGVE